MRFLSPINMIGIGAAVVSLGLAAAVSTAVAQTATPTPAQSSTPAQSQAKTNYQNFFIDRLAADLGTTVDKLKSAMTQARNETVDQAVKDGKLTQQQADRIKSSTSTRPGFGLGLGFGPGRSGHGRWGAGFVGGAQERAAIAQVLGMTPQDLNTQLQTKTLAQLAQGKEQAVKDAISNAVKARLDQAVKSGKMTQDQENQRLAQVQNIDLSKIGGHPAPAPHPWGNGNHRQRPTE